MRTRAETTEEGKEQRDERSSREGAEQRERRRRRIADADRLEPAGRRLGERNEHRVAGRMGLVPGDVEVAHAEREVDRIDVFERGREVKQVRDEEKNRDRRELSLHAAQTGRKRRASFRLPRR